MRALEQHLPGEAIDELKDLPGLHELMLKAAVVGRRVGDSAYVVDAPAASLFNEPWQGWAKRWHINSPCSIDWGRAVSIEWRRTGQRPSFPLPLHLGEGLPQIPRASHTVTAANPISESREQAAERAREEWDRTANLLRRDHALTPIQPTPRLAEQCEWVVLHRVFDTTYSDLAQKYIGRDSDSSAVGQAVRRIERLIGLRRLSGPT